MTGLINAAIGGWVVRSGFEAALDGRSGWAFTFAVLGMLNLAIAVADHRKSRASLNRGEG